MADTNQQTIQVGSVVILKIDPQGQRTLEMTVVGIATGQSVPVVKGSDDRWFLCRWQWDGQFHTEVFNVKELRLLYN